MKCSICEPEYQCTNGLYVELLECSSSTSCLRVPSMSAKAACSSQSEDIDNSHIPPSQPRQSSTNPQSQPARYDYTRGYHLPRPARTSLSDSTRKFRFSLMSLPTASPQQPPSQMATSSTPAADLFHQWVRVSYLNQRSPLHPRTPWD